MQRTNLIKQLSDEEFFLMRMEYDYLLALEKVFSDRELINQATRTHQAIFIDGQPNDIKTLDRQNLFTFDGEKKENFPANIHFDERILNPPAGSLEAELPLRERIIINAAAMHANVMINTRYVATTTFVGTEAMKYRRLEQEDKVHQNEHKQKALALEQLSLNMLKIEERVMPKIEPIRLIDPRSYSLNEDSVKKIKQVKTDYHLLFLIKRLSTLSADYKQLGRSKHQASIDKLIRNANDIFQSNDSTQDKLQKILGLIEKEFAKQLQNYREGFNFFRVERKAKDFIEFINKDTKDYQFPRLLAVILKNTYRDTHSLSSNAQLKELLQYFDSSNSQYHDVYAKKMADNLNDFTYDPFHQSLKQAGLNNTEIKKLFTTSVAVNGELIKQLWPELQEYGFIDEDLKKLITLKLGPFGSFIQNKIESIDPNDLVKKQNVSSMHATLDEFSGSANKITAEERKQLHANIAKKYSTDGIRTRLVDIKSAIDFMTNRQAQIGPAQVMQPHPQI